MAIGIFNRQFGTSLHEKNQESSLLNKQLKYSRNRPDINGRNLLKGDDRLAWYISASALLCYCLTSIGMILINKLILSSYQFKMNFFVLTIQSAVSLGLLEIFCLLKISSRQPFSYEYAKRWLGVSFLLGSRLFIKRIVFMIYSGSKALQYLSIPIFTIFKNFTIIGIAFTEWALFEGPRVTSLMLFSFSLMVISSVVAGWADINALKTDANMNNCLLGYIWMFLNCTATGSFTLKMKANIKLVKFKDFDTVFYNNLLTLPIVLTLSLIFEWPEALKLYQKYFANPEPKELYWLIFSILISGASSFGISFSSAWAIRVCSSTTYW